MAENTPNWPTGAEGYPPPGPYAPPSGVPPWTPAGYAPQPYYGAGVDPAAPYGRDPVTGEPLSDKSRIAAGLLQLFLGGFGVGRFYIGSIGIAVAQLLTWTVGLLLAVVLVGFVIWGVLGIWVFVDAILMFTGSVRDGHGRPLRS